MVKEKISIRQEEMEKEIALKFFSLLSPEKLQEARGLFAPDCKHHNPYAAPGMDALLDAIKAVQKEERDDMPQDMEPFPSGTSWWMAGWLPFIPHCNRDQTKQKGSGRSIFSVSGETGLLILGCYPGCVGCTVSIQYVLTRPGKRRNLDFLPEILNHR